MGISSPGQAGTTVPLVPTMLLCSARTTMDYHRPPWTTVGPGARHSPVERKLVGSET